MDSSAPPRPSSRTELLPRSESPLAPVDRGFGAWSFLTAIFFLESIIWGFPNSFGVFLEAYFSDPFWSSQKRASFCLPLIGTLSSGIIYCSGVVIYPIIARYPHHRRTSLWLGGLFCWASLFLAGSATKVEELVLYQGVIYGIGGSLLYAPCISFLSEWFVRYRGFANGVLFAGTAVGAFILPLVLPRIFSVYGISTTLRILSMVVAAFLFLLLPFIKGRIPANHLRLHTRPSTDKSWIKDKSFWLLIVANIIQGFGYFVPVIWLPTFAAGLHLSHTNSAMTLSMLNAASVIGRLLTGFLADKYSSWFLGFAALLSTSIAVFVLWGVLSYSFGGLLAFGMAYGLLAGGWTSLYATLIRPIAKGDPALETIFFGYLMLTRGFGNILSAPISSQLVAHTKTSVRSKDNIGFGVAGGRFQNIIVYTGTCFAGAAMCALIGWRMEVRETRNRRAVTES